MLHSPDESKTTIDSFIPSSVRLLNAKCHEQVCCSSFCLAQIKSLHICVCIHVIYVDICMHSWVLPPVDHMLSCCHWQVKTAECCCFVMLFMHVLLFILLINFVYYHWEPAKLSRHLWDKWHFQNWTERSANIQTNLLCNRNWQCNYSTTWGIIVLLL